MLVESAARGVEARAAGGALKSVPRVARKEPAAKRARAIRAGARDPRHEGVRLMPELRSGMARRRLIAWQNGGMNACSRSQEALAHRVEW
ncbi:hypothetical protein [Sorangium sp. So ce1389]|uniref:hypothetical protein n=1 Tax=Sorangium sp. So ce1389 TaxID=3133336 RepID=UPI003F5F8CD3